MAIIYMAFSSLYLNIVVPECFQNVVSRLQCSLMEFISLRFNFFYLTQSIFGPCDLNFTIGFRIEPFMKWLSVA